VVARLAIVAVCVIAVATLGLWDHDARRCTGTELDLVALGLSGRVPGGGPQAASGRLDDACVDATPLANAAAALAVRPAQAAVALRLGRRATVREPQTFAAWVGLGDALASSGDPVRAGAAYGRAQQLNPRWAGRLVAPVVAP
jgi:hypothetical protein